LFTVVATDGGTPKLFAEKAITVTVTDVNEGPTITSVATGRVAENAAISTVIYTAIATDPDTTSPNKTITYSIKAGGDAALVAINATTGAVTLLASANFEVKSTYLFTVVATDGGTPKLFAEKAITVTVLNQPEGTTGNDVFELTYSASTVTVLLGTTALGSFPLTAPLTLFGLGGTDSVKIVGTTGNDVIEVLSSGLLSINGATLILNSIESQLLVGGAGNDSYRFDADSSLGLFSIDEVGGGVDAIDFSPTSAGITINLGLATTQVVNVNLSLNLNSAVTIENGLGGDGTDLITGNALDNILVGNAGSDILNGLAGRDILIGGLGVDTLNGGDGEDILIGGRTTNDSVLSQLNVLRAEWISANSYADRQTHLRAGVGTPLASLKAKDTVLNDAPSGSVDTLTGGNGQDWYFGALDDVITELTTGELLDVL
ncbi:MAG: hypothetical protein DWI22_05535, partial [Planctomycetota bacterium]